MTAGGSSKGFFSSTGGYPIEVSTSAMVGFSIPALRARSAIMRGEGASESRLI